MRILPGDDDARLLRQPAQRFEGLGLLFLRDHALQNAGAVAKDGEEQLARFAQVVKPALHRHFFAGVLPGVFDVHYGRLGHDAHSRQGVRIWYTPPPPVFFCKHINPWELLRHFMQGYHSKVVVAAHSGFTSKMRRRTVLAFAI